MVDKNNFDGVRIGLASIVFFAHLAVLTDADQFRILIGIFDGNFAVKGFFAVSGFLVTKSYLSSSSLKDYSEKRFRRIYPAYIAAIFLCFWVGVFTSSLSFYDFVAAPDTLKYIAANALLLNFIQPTLPLSLQGNPTSVLNGSLWTIKVEAMLYMCVPFIVFFAGKIGRLKTAVLIFCASVLWVYVFTDIFGGGIGKEIARQFPGQLSYFVMGAIFSLRKEFLPKIKYLALASLCCLLLTDNYYLRLVIDPIAYSSIVIYLSTSAFRSLGLGKYGDISYGIYLYHFPVIQIFVFYGLFDVNLWLGLFASLGTTLLLALGSWHFLEKRLLRRNSYYVVAAKTDQGGGEAK